MFSKMDKNNYQSLVERTCLCMSYTKQEPKYMRVLLTSNPIAYNEFKQQLLRESNDCGTGLTKKDCRRALFN